MQELTIDLNARYEMIPVLARQYLDAPGVLYGRDPNTGIDCLGLVAMAATQAGFDCPSMLIRTLDPTTGRRPPMMEAVEKDMARVELNDIRPGDMLLLRPPYCPYPWDHLAVVSFIKPVSIIHTDPLLTGGVTEHPISESRSAVFRNFFGLTRRFDMSWIKWVRGAYRFQYLWSEDKPEVKSVALRSTLYGRETAIAVSPGHQNAADWLRVNTRWANSNVMNEQQANQW